MKNILLPTLVIHMILFMCWAFIIADLNPFNWGSGERASFIGIAIMCSLLYQLFTNLPNFDEY
jgi:multisubunit Na+/H+ antiporter MnhE subunit